ncbi:MAG: glycosyltransferase [Candidatus Omnitrophota bacterium]|nr:glycosyltransferase [Candidatus Omnitrophota bacterium]
MRKVTVIICTYNRAASLQFTLKAISEQIVGDNDALDVIVVDNNSSDGTKAVFEGAEKNMPFSMQYVFEGRQGLSYARNAGIQSAMGELLIFTDDDVMPKMDWVSKTVAGFSTHEADCVGGKVLPLWEEEKPSWLSAPRLERHCEGLFAVLDHGDLPLIRDVAGRHENFVYGANMAFRRKLFAEVGLFRTDLGRMGSKLAGGEETEMLGRILSLGKKVVWLPESVVYHRVAAERLRLPYMRRRRFEGGRSEYVSQPAAARKLPPWYYRQWFITACNVVRHYLKGRRVEGVESELYFWHQTGRIVARLEDTVRGFLGQRTNLRPVERKGSRTSP